MNEKNERKKDEEEEGVFFMRKPNEIGERAKYRRMREKNKESVIIYSIVKWKKVQISSACSIIIVLTDITATFCSPVCHRRTCVYNMYGI